MNNISALKIMPFSKHWNTSLRGVSMPIQGNYLGWEAFCGSGVQHFVCTSSQRSEVPGVLLPPSFPCHQQKQGRQLRIHKCLLNRGVVLVCCGTTCFKDPLLSSSPCENLVRVEFFDWTNGVSRGTPETPFNSSRGYLRLLKTSNWIFKAKII